MTSSVVHSSAPLDLGPTAAGHPASRSYRPSVLEVAQAIGFEQEGDMNFPQAVPIPLGMDIVYRTAHEQVQLVLKLDVFALRMRKVFGAIFSLFLI